MCYIRLSHYIKRIFDLKPALFYAAADSLPQCCAKALKFLHSVHVNGRVDCFLCLHCRIQEVFCPHHHASGRAGDAVPSASLRAPEPLDDGPCAFARVSAALKSHGDGMHVYLILLKK